MNYLPIIPIPIIIIISLFLIIINRKDKLTIFIILLLFIINLRPVIITKTTTKQNILFIIDTTYSMNDSYNKTTKINQAKKDIKKIINNIDNDISVITFNNNTNIIVPFTQDKTYINNSIDNIKTIDKIYANGSSLNTPLPTLKEYLKDKKNIVLIYISDGESTEKEDYQDYKQISSEITDGLIIGYDNKNSSLQEIAYNLNINYYDSKHKRRINNKINKIRNNNLKSSNKKIELFYIFLIPLLILFFMEIREVRRYL